MVDKASLAFTRRGVLRGVVLGWPFLLSSGVTGLVMGVGCRQVGMDLWLAGLFSTVVYSGTAQAVALHLWSAGTPVVAVVAAALTVNARYLAMGAHLAALFPDVPRRRMLPTLFLLADGAWLIATSEAERGRRDLGLLLGASLPMALGWVAGTAIGQHTALTLSGPFAAAATFVPLGFVVAYLPAQWRGLPSLGGWLATSASAIVLLAVVAPHWAMLGGGIVGSLVSIAMAARDDDP